MDWNWACEQLLKEKKVRCKYWGREEYIYICTHDNFIRSNGVEDFFLEKIDLEATDWELYQDSITWGVKDIELAKAWYNLGFKYVFRCEFSLMMLSRETNSKEYEKGTAFQDIDYDYFPSLKVGECVALQDIIDSEVK